MKPDVRLVHPSAARHAFTLAAIVFVGCSHQPRFEPLALAPAEHAALRDRVRGYAKAHCGSCHQSSLPSAKPAALAIYDLDSESWAAMLTVARLQNGFPRRLNAHLDDAGRQQLRSFIQSELALRAQ
jgi:mono/diheme cytochrome c family protein